MQKFELEGLFDFLNKGVSKPPRSTAVPKEMPAARTISRIPPMVHSPLSRERTISLSSK